MEARGRGKVVEEDFGPALGGPGEWLQAFWYYYPKTRDVDYVNDVGYLPNGESIVTVGNAGVRPPAPDPRSRPR